MDGVREQDDVPVGGRRLLQQVDGYDATIVVSGVVTRRCGFASGIRPGQLLRGAQENSH
jgi:N-acyl-D-aspartate/D-glutamate deacylase